MSDVDFTLPPHFAFDSPYLTDYFGIWQISEDHFRSLVSRCNGSSLIEHVKSAQVRQQVESNNSRIYEVTKDGIARISINGPMMKAVPSMANGTSTVNTRRQISLAKRDPEVIGALLNIDSPGGAAKGNLDLADEIASFATVKPIFCHIEDMCASAGVSIASQATKRYANNATAIYGCCGTYSVIEDMSGMAGQLGIVVHVIRAGAFKGLGESGTKITDEQLAELQRVVNTLNEGYLSTIARGLNRTVDSIRPLADGRVIFAADAVKEGLINGIQTYKQTYQELLAFATKSKITTGSNQPQRRSPAMEKTPATLAELKATFPKSTADWRESQIESGASLQEASISYVRFVEAKADEERAAHAKALEKAQADATAKAKEDAAAEAAKNKTRSGSLGHQALTAQNASEGSDEYEGLETGDPVEDFNSAVAKVAGKNPDLTRRQRAIRQVASLKPALYQAYLIATNPGKKQHRLITEKLEAVGK